MHTGHGDGFRHLTSFNEVIDALGGPNAVAEMTRNSRTSIWNWKRAGQFPPRHYWTMRQKLLERGCIAGLHLWAFSGTAGAKEPADDTVAA